MADGLQVFGTGEKPPSAKMNKLARRVVIDVASAANLPTSPAAGMTCHLLDTGELFYFNGTNWLVRPKGWAGSATLGGTGVGGYIMPGAGTVGVNGSQVTVTGTGHAFYKYTLQFGLNSVGQDVTWPGDTFSIHIKRTSGGTTTPLGIQKEIVVPPGAITTSNIWHTFFEIDFAPVGTCLYEADITAVGGNQGGAQIPGGSALVEHIGGIFLG